MGPAADAPSIEAFHLAFLEVFRQRLDPARYALKGGANLRYFFDSARYSEDIDLDVFGVQGSTLERNVDATLASPALAVTLRSAGLALDPAAVSKPKQSDTTRRWKIPIIREATSDTVRTKVEFSSRAADDDRLELAAVPQRVAQPYGLRPPTVRHYAIAPATEQKVSALAGRSETQARDVFDLDLLLRRAPRAADTVRQQTRKAAAERALELPYDAFADQVLPFLDRGVAELYDPTAWDQMQLHVTERLLEDGR